MCTKDFNGNAADGNNYSWQNKKPLTSGKNN